MKTIMSHKMPPLTGWRLPLYSRWPNGFQPGQPLRQRRMALKKTAPPLRQEDYQALADLRFALRQFMDFSA